ncbi:hypothetical protein NM208_g5259 [Fusarium decemcellulare]|uniref:Uncharacterized protein n=1 Tax=Fusarium decemcellulare TaxID=57161 RepID=A0ACC1SHW1_9HYPO|nr:hypothetical protein NM208_g5259 [Fusarium decemcellulare]
MLEQWFQIRTIEERRNHEKNVQEMDHDNVTSPPTPWAINLVEEFSKLVHRLTETPNVSLDELKDFLCDRVSTHTRRDFVGKLVRKDIQEAMQWLEDKGVPATPQQSKRHSQRSGHGRPHQHTDEDETEAEDEIETDGDEEDEEDDVDEESEMQDGPHSDDEEERGSEWWNGREICRGQRVETTHQGQGNLRKRTITHADDDCDDAQDTPPSSTKRSRIEVQLPTCGRPIEVQEQRRTPLGSPQETFQTPQPDCMEMPHTVPHGQGRRNDGPTETHPKKLYLTWLDDQIVGFKNTAQRSRVEMNAIVDRQHTLAREIEAKTRAKRQSGTGIFSAQERLDEVMTKSATESALHQDLLRLVDKHASVIPSELRAAMEALNSSRNNNTNSQMQAEADLSSQQEYLETVCNSLQALKQEAACLDSKFEMMRESAEGSERQMSSHAILWRFVEMGPSMIELLEQSEFEFLDQWTKDKLAEANGKVDVQADMESTG